ncbi:hypothetical protein CMEL01_16516 [Colletotrichum melonis]|uniref:Cupin type-1 domain-containing protein n=2 Tax=Colletotrichum acutatum species complex TaxID=2707335 RepID=A0AAI9UD94_9PEZI|nr:hypothetical protein CLIM01_03160 [Colletotrichum limetticola]KAK1456248.1 hypothetical protein CMEL01_16516 [Colletotrichum melonis]
MSSYEKVAQPEAYPLKRTAHCPNNDLPVLIYRDVLQPLNEESASERLQRHGWEKKGTWGTISLKHFHPNTHECYGVFQGSSELVFGEGVSDDVGSGVRCIVRAGDVVVVPAGVGHASVSKAEGAADPVEGEPEYRYVGVYPKGSPHYKYEIGKKKLEEKSGLLEEVSAVPVPPNDPLYGIDGPLVRIWNNSRGIFTSVREALKENNL